jgi:hypothetical protein
VQSSHANTADSSQSTIRPKIERGAPDATFVSKLARVSLEMAKTHNELIKQDIVFRHLMESNLAEGGRSSYIQICAPFELHALVTLTRPKHIVEVGVSAGLSSTYFLHALELNGKGMLHSIDLPEREIESTPPRKISWALPPGKNSGWAVPQSLKKNWDLRLGKCNEILPDLIKEVESVDLFLYDVPYEIEVAESDFAVADQKLREGSIVLADNCPIPISWWARRRRRSRIVTRKNSGLQGFSLR